MLSTANIKSDPTGPIAISSKRLGDLAEQWVTMLAAWKGAEVYPNANSTGSADLLIRWQDKVIQVDVKVSTFNKTYWHAKNTHTVKDPVFPLVVEPDGDIADWRVRWLPHRTPMGWEEFWAKDYRTVTTKPSEPTDTSR